MTATAVTAEPTGRPAGSPAVAGSITGRPQIAVVGGGLAGITAALHAADNGARVVLYEAKPRLGGLTMSFRRHGLWVDNGQHVFLRCCTAYLRLLRRLGVAGLVRVQPTLDIPLRGAGRNGSLRTGSLRAAALPAPFHLGGAVLGFGWLPPAERIRAARTALALRTVDRTDPVTDTVAFGDWLRAHGESRRAIATLWDLLILPTLNGHADEVSLALAATVFQLGLLTDPHAADIGVPLVPLHRLHAEPAALALRAAGVDVRLGTRVTDLAELDEPEPRTPAPGAQRSGQDTAAGEPTPRADVIVVATPPAVTERLVPAATLGLDPGWSAALGGVPILNLHVVLDRAVLHQPFLAAVDGPLQWVFDRTRQSGLTDGQYLAVSLSAAEPYADEPTVRLREHFEPHLRRLLPELADAEIRDFFVTRERQATFRPAPGSARLRPPARTADRRVLLAGAWTDTGWPATMEGAVRSGETAAAAALDLVHNGSPVGQEVLA